jgi:hypothetical protein
MARRPVGLANRLEIINKDPGREYRLVDALPHRMYQFEQAGWRLEDLSEHVPGYKRVDNPTSVDNALMVGAGQQQVLMSIEKELYEEDQAAKRARNKELEDSLKPKNSDGMYGAELSVTHK